MPVRVIGRSGLFGIGTKADWHGVDWSGSDREIAAQLGVSHGAVAKRRKKMGHASDYTVDAVLLRGWFEHHRSALSQMTNRDIEVLVFDELGVIGFNPAYWREKMPSADHVENAQPKSVAVVR